MKRTRLKSKEVSKWLEPYSIQLSKKDKVELAQEELNFIVINDIPSFFYYKEQIIPTLKYLQENIILPKITVDMGAIKFVVNGADIMRPGITKIDENIKANDFIVIVDENNQKPLAVGIALLNSQEMESATSGKVIKNIHFVGDELWNI